MHLLSIYSTFCLFFYISGIVTSEASSAFIVLYQGQPFLLIDLGYGVYRQFREHFREFAVVLTIFFVTI